MFKFVRPSELKKLGVLGMNYRNYELIGKNNPRKLYPLVDNKIKTKELAAKVGIKTPKLIGIISYQHEVKDFILKAKNLNQFVIKPAQGSGGKGVLVIKKHTGDFFETSSLRLLSDNEIYQHISNILSGLYSLGGKNDEAVIEEMVDFTDCFKDYSFQGVPDVRIIVYKGYPVLAMTRLATKQSGGRANLHQGAVGVGLDLTTGHASYAVHHNLSITHHPDTKVELKELSVPFWKEHLLIAAKAFEMTGLGYLGADIVLDKNKGPMMLELNARPGLSIQIANQKGLLKRIKEIDTYPTGLTANERVEFLLK